ncbi:MAG TPA: hypothetical protein VFE62_19575 [Gemmataceae bacterium]|nr:hypothetical protein [Gemmataceae bacterium]
MTPETPSPAPSNPTPAGSTPETPQAKATASPDDALRIGDAITYFKNQKITLSFSAIIAVVSSGVFAGISLWAYSSTIDNRIESKVNAPLKEVSTSIKELDTRLTKSLKESTAKSVDKERELDDLKYCILVNGDMAASICSRNYDQVITSFNEMTTHQVSEDKIPDAFKSTMYQSLIQAYASGDKLHLLTEQEVTKMDNAIRKNTSKCNPAAFNYLGIAYLATRNSAKARRAFQMYLLECEKQVLYPEYTAYAYSGLLLANILELRKAAKDEQIRATTYTMEQNQGTLPVAYSAVADFLRLNKGKGVVKLLAAEYQQPFADGYDTVVDYIEKNQKITKVRYGRFIYLEGVVIVDGKKKAILHPISLRPKEENIPEGKNPPKVEITMSVPTGGCCYTPPPALLHSASDMRTVSDVADDRQSKLAAP